MRNVINRNEDLRSNEYNNEPFEEIWLSILKNFLEESYIMLHIKMLAGDNIQRFYILKKELRKQGISG